MRSRKAKRSGTEGGHAHAFTAQSRPDGIRLLGRYGSGVDGFGECPVCGLTVSLKDHGVLGPHRIGRNRANSWLCLGNDPGTL